MFDEAMPATLGEDEEVSAPSVDEVRTLSVDRAREWVVEPNANPLAEVDDIGGDGIGAAPEVAKGE